MATERAERWWNTLRHNAHWYKAWEKPTAEIIRMREEGKLTADIVNKELVGAIETTFGGAAEQAGNSISAALSNFEYAVSARQQDLFAPAIKYLATELNQVNDVLFSSSAVEAASEMGITIQSGAEAVVGFTKAAVQAGDVLSDVVQPAIAGAGTAAAIAGTQWLVAGGAANILAGSLANVASTAWVANAAIRGIIASPAGALTAMGAGMVVGFTYYDKQLSDKTDAMAEASYAMTAGARSAADAFAVYDRLSVEAQAKLGDTYQRLIPICVLMWSTRVATERAERWWNTLRHNAHWYKLSASASSAS
ncbi:MAG: hypothetical protein HC893_00325 [Chloroflexaceae bacterium]|nr:hypothetical protein [Chloroflexaceae bacterium]